MGMEHRELCLACGQKPRAVNYKRKNKVYYRTRCDSCIRKKRKLPTAIPGWYTAKYRKKPHCEKCGFKAKLKEQLFVFYIDGNLNNNDHLNLKTVCANCQYEVAKAGWVRGALVPDF